MKALVVYACFVLMCAHMSCQYTIDNKTPYTKLEAWLQDFKNKHKDLVNLLEIGNSSNGLPIYLLKLQSHKGSLPVKLNKSTKNKWSLWFDCGLHGIGVDSTEICKHLAKRLVDPINKRLVDNFDWHIVPLLNPDAVNNPRDSNKTVDDSKQIYNFPSKHKYDAYQFHGRTEVLSVVKYHVVHKYPFRCHISIQSTRKSSHIKNNAILLPHSRTSEPVADIKHLKKVANNMLNVINNSKYQVQIASDQGEYHGSIIDYARDFNRVKYSMIIQVSQKIDGDEIANISSAILNLADEILKNPNLPQDKFPGYPGERSITQILPKLSVESDKESALASFISLKGFMVFVALFIMINVIAVLMSKKDVDKKKSKINDNKAIGKEQSRISGFFELIYGKPAKKTTSSEKKEKEKKKYTDFVDKNDNNKYDDYNEYKDVNMNEDDLIKAIDLFKNNMSKLNRTGKSGDLTKSGRLHIRQVSKKINSGKVPTIVEPSEGCSPSSTAGKGSHQQNTSTKLSGIISDKKCGNSRSGNLNKKVCFNDSEISVPGNSAKTLQHPQEEQQQNNSQSEK